MNGKVLLCALALPALVACVPPGARHHAQGRLKPIARLDCPDFQGALTRTSADPSGSACRYSGPDGAEVELKLVPAAGGPDTALQPIEADLKTLLPPPAPKPAPAAPAPAVQGGDRDKDVNINLPGLSIHARDNGEAKIDMPGVHINADDRTDSAHVVVGAGPFHRHGHVTVDAEGGAAVIRSRSGGADVNDTLVIASDSPGAQGWRAVGYTASGPRTGPLVVATIKCRTDDHEQAFNDARTLVRRVSRS